MAPALLLPGVVTAVVVTATAVVVVVGCGAIESGAANVVSATMRTERSELKQ
jgi:uncharacterized membrane protein HdeD (DUF308 family)